MAEREALTTSVTKNDLETLLRSAFSAQDSAIVRMQIHERRAGRSRAEEATVELRRRLDKVIGRHAQDDGVRLQALGMAVRTAIHNATNAQKFKKFRDAVHEEFQKALRRLQAQFGVDVSCAEKSANDRLNQDTRSIDASRGTNSHSRAAETPVPTGERADIRTEEPLQNITAEEESPTNNGDKDTHFGAFIAGECVGGDARTFVERGIRQFFIARYRDFLGIVAECESGDYSSAEIRALVRLQQNVLEEAQKSVDGAAATGFSSFHELRQALLWPLDTAIPKNVRPEIAGYFHQWFRDICMDAFTQCTAKNLHDYIKEHQTDNPLMKEESVCRILMARKITTGNSEVSAEEIALLRQTNPQGKKGKRWKVRAHAHGNLLNNTFHGGYALRDEETIERMLRYIRSGRCEGLRVIGTVAAPPEAEIAAPRTPVQPRVLIEVRPQDEKIEEKVELDTRAPIPPTPLPEDPLLHPRVIAHVEEEILRLPHHALSMQDLERIQVEIGRDIGDGKPLNQEQCARLRLLVKITTEAAIIRDLLVDLQTGAMTIKDFEEIVRENAYPTGVIWCWHSLRELARNYANGGGPFILHEHVSLRLRDWSPISQPVPAPIRPAIAEPMPAARVAPVITQESPALPPPRAAGEGTEEQAPAAAVAEVRDQLETDERQSEGYAMYLQWKTGAMRKALDLRPALCPAAASFDAIQSECDALDMDRIHLEIDVRSCVERLQASGVKNLAFKIVRTGDLDRKTPAERGTVAAKMEAGQQSIARHKELTQRIHEWEGRIAIAQERVRTIERNADSAIGEVARLREYLFGTDPMALFGAEIGAMILITTVPADIRARIRQLEERVNDLSEAFQDIREEHASVCSRQTDYRNYSLDDVEREVQRALQVVERFSTTPSSHAVVQPPSPLAAASVLQSTHALPDNGSVPGAFGGEYFVPSQTIVIARFGTGRKRHEVPLNDLQRRLVCLLSYNRKTSKPHAAHGEDLARLHFFWEKLYGHPVPSEKQIRDALDAITFPYKDTEVLDAPPTREERQVDGLILRYRYSKKGGKSGVLRYLSNDNTFAAVNGFPEELRDDAQAERLVSLKRAEREIFARRREIMAEFFRWARQVETPPSRTQMEERALTLFTSLYGDKPDQLQSTVRYCVRQILKERGVKEGA